MLEEDPAECLDVIVDVVGTVNIAGSEDRDSRRQRLAIPGVKLAYACALTPVSTSSVRILTVDAAMEKAATSSRWMWTEYKESLSSHRVDERQDSTASYAHVVLEGRTLNYSGYGSRLGSWSIAGLSRRHLEVVGRVIAQHDTIRQAIGSR